MPQAWTPRELFDSILRYARAGQLDNHLSSPADFRRVFHELLDVRVRVGDPELEAELVKNAESLCALAKPAIEAFIAAQTKVAPAAFEPHGDAHRLVNTKLLPDRFKYQAASAGATSSVPVAAVMTEKSVAGPAAVLTRKTAAKAKKKARRANMAPVAPAVAPVSDARVHETTTTGEGADCRRCLRAWSTRSRSISWSLTPENDRLFQSADAAAERDFRADLADHGADHPLVACGPGGASPPGTLLEGHRRRLGLLAAGHATARVLFRRDLTASDEIVVMIRGNIADSHARKLTEEAKFRLEEEVRRAAGERRGRPRGGDNSVASDGICGTETATLIGAKLTATPHAVRDRAKIFGTPLCTPKLRDAVNRLEAKLSPAAELVRKVEGQFGLARGGGGEPASEGVLSRARATLDAQLKAMLAPAPKRPATKSGQENRGDAPVRSASDAKLAGLTALENMARSLHDTLLERRKGSTRAAAKHIRSALGILAPIAEGGLRTAIDGLVGAMASSRKRPGRKKARRR